MKSKSTEVQQQDALTHAGWRKVTVGDILQLEYGKPLPDEERLEFGRYPIYGANGEKGRTDRCYYDQPSIIVGRKGSAGELTFSDGGFWPLDVTYFVKPKKEVDLRFAWYLLNSLNLTSLAKGIKPGINRNEVYSIRINIPPLMEQKRIASILDEVFTGIDTAQSNAEKVFERSRTLFTSYLDNLVGSKSSLGSLVDIKTGKLDANAAVDGGLYPFFTCSREIYAIDRFAFDCHAILLAGNNAVGDFNVKIYNGKFNAYQRTYVITVLNEKELSHRYLYYQILKSMKEFKRKSVGAGTKFLKIGMIQDLQIIHPSLSVQESIVASLDSLLKETQRLEAVISQKLLSFNELRRSLLQQSLSGNL